MQFVFYSSETVYYRDVIHFDEEQVLDLAEFVAHEESREVSEVLEELKTKEGRERIGSWYWYDCFYDLMKFEIDESDHFELDDVVSRDDDQD